MISQLKNKFPLGEAKWAQYERCFKRLEVPAKTILLHEGDIARKAYFIEKGSIRVWFNSNGKDVTFQFFFENDRVSSVESFRKNIPSIAAIETIEPCILWAITKKDMGRMMNDCLDVPELREKLLTMLFDRNLHYIKHSLSFVRDTPEQRYLNLLNEQPHVVKRIPQHYIASYLGVSKVHLSRIKAKLLSKAVTKK